MNQPCEQKTAIEMLDNRLDRIEDKQDRTLDKIDKLSEFKWKVMGAGLMLGSIAGLLARFV